MAEKEPKTDEATAEGADGEGGEDAPKKKLAGKMIVIFAAVPVLLIGAAAFFLVPMFLGGGEEAASDEALGIEGAMVEAADGSIIDGAAVAIALEEELASVPVFYDLPEMTVNLGGVEEGRPSYLKVTMALELSGAGSDETIAQLDAMSPRLLDRCQVFLRQLRPRDLNDAAALFRLKRELLRRVNIAVAPAVVDDIVFKQMLIQ